MTFRPGSVGALMDEYERAAREMKHVLSSITDDEYVAIADPRTPQVEMRSIRSIMRHVVEAGYGYATYIGTAMGKKIERPKAEIASRTKVASCVDDILRFMDGVVAPHYTMPEDEMDTITMRAPWSVTYTIDQMLEHAVMHIHRHRRQLERLLEQMRTSG